MRYLHSIESTNDTEQPVWQVIALADEAEEYEGTAADYGREVLDNWITDHETSLTEDGGPGITDEYGNPRLRVRVAFADNPEAFVSDLDYAAIVDCTDLEPPAPELAAVEAARDRKLYAALLDRLADDALTTALRAARESGQGANRMAELVYPAVSRPIALRMMR